jgi:hypothetical protein
MVAVFQSSLPRVIESQSTKPVSAVPTVTTRPTTRASHQACANVCSATPSLLSTAETVAKV